MGISSPLSVQLVSVAQSLDSCGQADFAVSELLAIFRSTPVPRICKAVHTRCGDRSGLSVLEITPSVFL